MKNERKINVVDIAIGVFAIIVLSWVFGECHFNCN